VVDASEQASNALAFYEARGFVRTGRSETDPRAARTANPPPARLASRMLAEVTKFMLCSHGFFEIVHCDPGVFLSEPQKCHPPFSARRHEKLRKKMEIAGVTRCHFCHPAAIRRAAPARP
jgi:hypothetical protein